MKPSRSTSLSAIAIAMLQAGPTLAQSTAKDTTQVAPSGQAATPGDRDIVVTARRRAERLQDVPVAVTAVSGNALRAANIVQVQDIQQKVPGLTIQPSSFGSNVLQVAIRGQRQFDPYITKDPAVAVYFADVVQNRPQGLNAGMFDIDSVQVLKGPQGTLFGRNTTGGAMIITPVAPTGKFEGYAQVGYGNHNAKRAEGALNVPLTDWAALRFAGAIQRRDGYTNDVTTGQKLDDEHKDSWRVSLRLTPGAGITDRLVVNGFAAHENGVGYKLLGTLPGIGLGSAPNVLAELARVQSLPFYSTTSDLVLKTRIKTFSLANTTEIEVADGMTLRNIAGYRYTGSHTPFDFDGSSLTFTDATLRVLPYFYSREDMTARQYSDELQMLGKVFDGSLDYIFGGYYFLERGSDFQQTGGQGGVTINGVYQGDRITYGDPIRNQSYSGFAQFTYRLPFLAGVSLTVGGRLNHDLREITTRNLISNGTCRLVDASGQVLDPCQASYGKSFDRFTYTLSADWKILPDVLLYVAHRKGYRTGGFNISATTPNQFTPFLPEDVKDYEVGLKTSFHMGGGSGTFNIAAYDQDYKNIQRNQGSIINGVFTQTIVNAASARIRGFEAELALRPTRFLDFGVNVAHIDAHYTHWVSDGIDISGSMFAGTPSWTVSSNAGVTVPVGTSQLALRGDVYLQSRTNMSDNNWVDSQGRVSPTSILPGYMLVNGRVELRKVAGTNVTLAVWGKNLAGERYVAGGTELANTGLGYTAGFLGAPRMYGVELSTTF